MRDENHMVAPRNLFDDCCAVFSSVFEFSRMFRTCHDSSSILLYLSHFEFCDTQFIYSGNLFETIEKLSILENTFLTKNVVSRWKN